MKIYELKYRELPYTYDNDGALSPKILCKEHEPTDDQGIPIFSYPKLPHYPAISLLEKAFKKIILKLSPIKVYYHPVLISQKALAFLDGYVISKNIDYLKKTEIYAQKIIDNAIKVGDAIFFPYQFDYYLHNMKHEIMKSPWYSGMAQGQLLSLFTRLYKVSKKEKLLEIAHLIFNSFKHLKGKSISWIAYIDEEGYYWIEEYPMEPPCNTLNGFIFAIYGLYDYYILKKDSESRELLENTINTIKRYIPDFRNKGNLSYYCLKHKVVSTSYHILHTKQLKMIYKMTRDKYFKKMADNLYSDGLNI